MIENKKSPRIIKTSWGQIFVEGKSNPFKDVKLYPGGCREWDWRETGTDHKPGIQPADVEELLEKGSQIIVLSRGVYGRLKVAPDTLDYLRDRGIKVEVFKTPQAVKHYNQLSESENVGALIHSTC
ncbi:MAG: Mth938-like domain-containing protein [Anaerolineales bacterium]|nr:Mth938-like domain-containing protein [Anaerolineales bacterium]